MSLHHIAGGFKLLLVFLLGAGLPMAGLAGKTALKDRPAKIVKEVKPQFPFVLKGTRYHKGAARIIFIVDENGEKKDFVVVATTHPIFGDAAMRSLKNWEILPAISGGQFVQSRFVVNIKFKQEGLVVVDDPMGMRTSNRLISHSNNFYYRVSEIYELDHQPKRIKTVMPTFPERMKLFEHSGQALIEFFLDPDGNVMAPGILSSSNDECGYAALGAITEWKYEPPLKNGKPVYVRAEQPFYFKFVEQPPAQLEQKKSG